MLLQIPIWTENPNRKPPDFQGVWCPMRKAWGPKPCFDRNPCVRPADVQGVWGPTPYLERSRFAPNPHFVRKLLHAESPWGHPEDIFDFSRSPLDWVPSDLRDGEQILVAEGASEFILRQANVWRILPRDVRTSTFCQLMGYPFGLPTHAC